MLREATEADLSLIRVWRNHPQVRAASLTTHEISPEEHLAWWRGVSADPSRQILVFTYQDQPAGVVTIADLDRHSREATWGYYLDYAGLQDRGELLPAWMTLEREAIGYAFDELGLARLGGETLAWNTPVLDLHRRYGFRETKSYLVDVDGTPQRVVWTELTADARRR